MKFSIKMTEPRFKTYDKNVCWQYDIRKKNLYKDLDLCGLSLNDIENLSCDNFILQQEEKSQIFNEVKEFIERHEWLGKMSLYPTHFFTARYNGILAGVVVMDMPNALNIVISPVVFGVGFVRLISVRKSISKMVESENK